MAYHPKKTHGFSLVETAIVLVIVALLVAAVFLGRQIIRNSDMQKIGSNFAQFRQAVLLFQEKYYYLPGDIPNASSFWGLRATCDDTSGDSTATSTCNGNGDGYITGKAGTPTEFGANYLEAIFLWQHLSNAQLVQGTYSGKAGSGVVWWKPGTNIPVGPNNRAGYTISYAGTVGAIFSIDYPGSGYSTLTGNSFSAKYYHVISFGNITDMPKTYTAHRMELSPTEAKMIDEKIDDGKPGLGNVLALATTNDGGVTYLCVTTNNISTAEYNISSSSSNNSKLCSLTYIMGIK